MARSNRQSTLEEYSATDQYKQFTDRQIELLCELRVCKRRHGNVEHRTIQADKSLASRSTYQHHFGSLATAKVEAGLKDYNRCPDCGLAFSQLGRHWRGRGCSEPELTSRQREILTGVVMGDGTVQWNGKTPSIVLQVVTRPFVEWFKDEMGVFGNPIQKISGEDIYERIQRHGDERFSTTDEFQDQYRVNTNCSHQFAYWSEWYRNGEKRFPEHMSLSPMTLLMWYVCDGGLQAGTGKETNRTSMHIKATNELDRPDFLRDLFKPIGISPAVDDGVVRFTVGETEMLFDYMPAPPPGFEYKFATTAGEYNRLKPWSESKTRPDK